MRFPENPDTLKFSLSTLHTFIRFFESILHLSFKTPIQKWQTRSEEDKRIVRDIKNNIQRKFKDELGLLVDIPKQDFGTSNDGNKTIRFFSDPEIASQIAGVDVELIKKLKVILEATMNG
ncbi:hypothetical protein AVEN_141673-1 [Araneus ventricosus]|uniref:Uncharacterized protein n=1 Tax=Araneus ventricosus TaxID=182803 RepID=A0A4Y2VZW1_ARAVE|nr:hypothetical protein AVEN_141673-1 [Araneus ventricosus]